MDSRHARNRPGGGGRTGGERGFAVAIVLLAFAATLPQGGTGFIDSRGVASAAWIMGVAGWIWKPAGYSAPREMSRWARWAAGVLVGWCFWQLLPLPESMIGRVWRGNPEWLRLVAADAPRFSIAVNRFVSLHTLCLWSGLGMLAWASSRRLRSRSAWQVVFWGAMALGVFQSVAGLVFLRSPGGRLVGTFGSPDALGGLLAMTLPMTLGLVFRHSGGPRLRGRSGWRWWTHRLATDWSAWPLPVLWLGFAVQGVGLLFSGSVGATIAAVTACGLLVAWQGRDHPSSRRVVMGAMTGLVLLAVVFSIHGYRRNVLNRSLDDSGDVWRSQASRFEIWRAAIQVCRQFPWGTGPGGTATVLSMFQTGVHGRFRLDYAHNDTLQYLGDLGLVGFGALVLLLALTGGQGARGCRIASPKDESFVWLRRGAWAAFLSALLHAQGEFNLSARPGIQVFFAMVCGLLWAGGAQPHAGRASEQPPTRPGSRWGAGVWLLVGVGVVVFSTTAAWAWRLHEAVQRGIGFGSAPPQWYSQAAIPPEQALDALQQANRLAPGSSVFLRGEAEVRMALHELRVEKAARSWLASSESDRDSQTAWDPLDPAVRQAREVGAVALRIEEVEMLKEAQVAAEAAVASAPWESSARLVLARVLFRRATLPTTESEAGIRGRQELELVTTLYPADAGVLAEACSILALARRAVDRQRLLDWGCRALALDPSRADLVLNAWRTSGVSMEQVLQSIRLPGRVLWQLYALLDREQRRREARQCLAVLERTLAEEGPPPESDLWVPAAWNRWQLHQARSRLRWTKESLKHALRAGDWNAVRTLAASRVQTLDEVISAELDTDWSGDASLAMRRLHLREWAAQGRLPPKWVVEWAAMELQAGLSAKSVQDPLLELFCLNQVDDREVQRLSAFRRDLTEVPWLVACLDAKEAEQAGRPAEAASILEAQRGAGLSLPHRFTHRLWLWHYQLLRQAGQSKGAEEALARAVEWCPSDPDVIAAAFPNDGAAPDTPSPSKAAGLDIRYKGGRLRLAAVWMEPSAGQSQEATLHLDWRFMGLLPPDLKLLVRLRDEKRRFLLRQSIEVDGVLAAHFNRGAPPLGSQWRATFALPPLAAAANRLEIIWSSASRSFPTDEGLSFLELDMESLPVRPKETVEPTAGQD